MEKGLASKADRSVINLSSVLQISQERSGYFLIGLRRRCKAIN